MAPEPLQLTPSSMRSMIASLLSLYARFWCSTGTLSMWSRGGGVCIMLSMGGGVGVPAIIPGNAPYGAEARLLCGGMLGNWFCIGGLLMKSSCRRSVCCENERVSQQGLYFKNHTGNWDRPSWIVHEATWAAVCSRSGRGPKTGERVNFLKACKYREDEHCTTATTKSAPRLNG